MNAIDVIHARRSVRNYLPNDVEIEKITTVLQAGNAAAWSKLAGKVDFVAITNKELLAKISNKAINIMKNSGNNHLMNMANQPNYDPNYGAPVIILFCKSKTDNPMVAKSNFSTAACAAQNMMIAATDLGLGSCYAMAPTLALEDAEGLESVGLTENDQVLCVVTLGYQDGRFEGERVIDDSNIRFIK